MWKNPFQRQPCCACHGAGPAPRCKCSCHRQEDCEFWETVAFAWVCDAADEPGRERLWQRFIVAYPQCAGESCAQFWARIRKTRWYQKHHHRFEHHHPYGDGR